MTRWLLAPMLLGSTIVGLNGCLDVPEQFEISLRFVLDTDSNDQALMGCEADVPQGEIPTFAATGLNNATLVVHLPCDTSAGKVLEFQTSLGELSATGSDKSSTQRTTVGAQDLFVNLVVGTTPGLGIVTVEGQGGLSDSAQFMVEPLNKSITITPPEGPLVADGFNEYPFEVLYSALPQDAVDGDPQPSDTPVSVKVRASRGSLAPQLTDNQQFERTVLLTPGVPLPITLFAGNDAGPGEFSVTLDTSVETSIAYQLVGPDDQITLAAPTTALFADGVSAHEVTLEVATETEEPLIVTLASTVGVLNPSLPDGPSRFADELTVSPNTPTVFFLYSPAQAGIGSLTATLATGASQSITTTFAATSDEITLAPEPGMYFADDITIIPVHVSLASPKPGPRTITLTTSTGSFGSAEGPSSSERTVVLEPGRDATVSLRAGRQAGVALLTAAIDGDAFAETPVGLAYSPPTQLSVSLNRSVLEVPLITANATVSFGRGPGEGRVSEGTEVEFLVCCDPDGDGTSEDCASLVDVPEFAVPPSSGQDSVSAPISLTPDGTTFVQTPGDPPTDDLAVLLHALVVDPTQAPASTSCAELDDVGSTPSDVLVLDSAALALRRVPAG